MSFLITKKKRKEKKKYLWKGVYKCEVDACITQGCMKQNKKPKKVVRKEERWRGA